MYLYPFKIFTISKNKKLFKLSEPSRTIGIYDADVFNYKQAEQAKCVAIGSSISVLLGKLTPTVSLIVLDLDDCFKDGEMEGQTKAFLEEFDDSEWEVSSSGTGIHIYILTTLNLGTFIVKDLEGCKSFECYTNKRHIVTTTFDFYNTNLKVDKHNDFIQELYQRVQKQKTEKQAEQYSQKAMVKDTFQGIEIRSDSEAFAAGIRKESPVTDMFTLRKCGYKDSNLIEIIDMEPSCVDQSAHDAKLIRKLMYYTFSFDAAWELAKKTNYYKHKDKFHQTKFNSDRYKERTRMFIEG